MRMWFELGTKIGCIELAAKLCSLPNIFISPHDVEDIHYEILDYMKKMGLDDSIITESKIEEYESIVLGQIESPNKKTKRQLFLLGYYTTKLRMLLLNELDDVFNEKREKLYGFITEIITSLNLSEIPKKISLDTYREEDFVKIEEAIKNNATFDAEEPVSQQNNASNGTVIAIIAALITAVATIIAAFISKA